MIGLSFPKSSVQKVVFLLLVWTAGAAPGQSPAISFRDVSADSGLTVPHISTPENRYIVESMSGGAALFDCDADGLLDAATVNGSSVERFKTNGGDLFVTLYRQITPQSADADSPKFENITSAAGLARRGWGMGVNAVDYDDDGILDLFVTGYAGNAVYRGTGRCRFEDVTEKTGLRGAGFSTGAAWADYDRDGDLDVFVARYVFIDLNNLPEFGSSPVTCSYRGIRVQCGPRGLPGETDFLFRNKGDGTFEDVSQRAGVGDARKHYGMQPIWGDYDDDGWPDLFVANDATYNYLYRNNKDGTFGEVGTELGVAYSDSGAEQGSMGVSWGDFDLDGRLDLFVSNFENEPNALYKNTGEKGFIDVVFPAKIGQTSRPYVGWGTAFADLDNDGWLDLLIANGHVYPQIELTEGKGNLGYRQPFLLFRNLGGGTFAEISEEAGLRRLALSSRRGVAFGDINNDGAVDALVVNLGAPPTVLLNAGKNQNRSVVLKLVQTGRNRWAVGARVTLRASGRTMVQEVQAGASYLSQNDSRLHFGLGSGEKIEEVTVRWSDGQTESVAGVLPNRITTITRGKGVTETSGFSRR